LNNAVDEMKRTRPNTNNNKERQTPSPSIFKIRQKKENKKLFFSQDKKLMNEFMNEKRVLV